jgi:hypothetical protein
MMDILWPDQVLEDVRDYFITSLPANFSL